jgi:hypothetical protein
MQNLTSSFLSLNFLIWSFLLLEALDEIGRRLFQNGFPVINMVALGSEEFVVAGEVMASSIAQGGPAPNILNASSFLYLASGIQSLKTDSVTVEDVLLKTAIDKVCII